MVPLRAAILVAFVGAILWVFAPLLNIEQKRATDRAIRAASGDALNALLASPATRELQSDDVRNEIVVVTVAGVLAGPKLKPPSA